MRDLRQHPLREDTGIKYRGDIYAEDGDEEFFASPPSDNDDEDLSDFEVVEKSKPKI